MGFTLAFFLVLRCCLLLRCIFRLDASLVCVSLHGSLRIRTPTSLFLRLDYRVLYVFAARLHGLLSYRAPSLRITTHLSRLVLHRTVMPFYPCRSPAPACYPALPPPGSPHNTLDSTYALYLPHGAPATIHPLQCLRAFLFC